VKLIKDLINYKIVLQEPSFIDKTQRSSTEGCYLAYKNKIM